MKTFLLISLGITMILNLKAQSYKIRFIDAKTKQKIENVTVNDAIQNIFIISDENGNITINEQAHNLVITHVSYKKKTIQLPTIGSETKLEIELFLKEKLLEEVVIKSAPFKPVSGLKNFGYYRNGKLAAYSFSYNQKVGVLLDDFPKDNIIKELKSIKFGLKNLDKISNSNSLIIINIFKFDGDSVSENTLNYYPITIKASELDRTNEIFIKEKIIIPPSGILISLMLPNVNLNFKDARLVFPARMDAKRRSIFYEMSSSVFWNKKTFENIIHDNNNMSIKFGITYNEITN